MRLAADPRPASGPLVREVRQRLFTTGGAAPWAAYAALLTLVVAIVAMIGWVFDVPRLRSILPGAVEMKVNTALALVLDAIALLIASTSDRSRLKRLTQILAMLGSAIGLATLAEYTFAWDLSIDEALFADKATAYNVYRGRMSPYSAAAFTALGIALAVLPLGRWRPVKWLCASFVIGIGAVSAVGYLWNAQELITDRLVPPVAINTAIVLMLLSLGTLQVGRRAWESRSGKAAGRLMNVEGTIIASLVIALALLFLGGGYTYRATVQFENSMTEFARMQDVRVGLARLIDLLGGAEVAQQSYLAGGPEAQRRLYDARRRELAGPLYNLIGLMAGEQRSARELQQLEADIAQWLAQMDREIEQRENRRLIPLEESMAAASANPLRGHIYDLLAGLDAEAADRQAMHRANATSLREFTLVSLLLTLTIATVLGGMLFRAVQRASRMRAESRTIDGRTRRLFALLARTLIRKEALEGTLEVLAELRPGSGCAFYALESDGLVLERTHGPHENLPVRLAPGEGIVGAAAALHKTRCVEHADQEGAGDSRTAGVVLACPVTYFDRVVGVLCVSAGKSLRTHERSFVERLADALGVALNNLKQYSDLEVMSAQLGARNEELRRQTGQLDQANRLKSEFLATMSHELRTPLNAIIGFAEVLKDELAGPLNDEQREYMGDIYDSGGHLLELINDILDLSKVEAGKMELDLEALELEPVLSNSFAMVKEQALTHRLSLSADIAPDLPPLWLDERKVKQIVYNLLSNAVKFTPDGGRVTLSVRRVTQGDATWLDLSVSDNGIGIDAEDQKRLFAPFVQIDGSLGKRFQGTGLGLAMVKRLAELHGGSAHVQSAPGAGSTFTVLLPYREISPADSAGRAGESVQQRSPVAVFVDADGRGTSLVQRALLEIGIEAVRACDLTDAFAQIAQRAVDVLVLDGATPEMERSDAVAALHSQARLTATPVVIVSITRGAPYSQVVEAASVLGTTIVREDLRTALVALGLVRRSGDALTALVVDDEPRVAEMLDAYLQSAGCNVIRATSGEEALAAAHALHPDVLVLDLLMPQMSGFDVIREMKAAATTRCIPIVVISAKTLSADDRQMLSGSVEAVLRKSEFKRAEFVDEVLRAATGSYVDRQLR